MSGELFIKDYKILVNPKLNDFLELVKGAKMEIPDESKIGVSLYVIDNI
jgi:hypothetical protein